MAPATEATKVIEQPTDQIGSWINEATRILLESGYSREKMNAGDIRLIINYESGGNPDAINNTDSNAALGTPSKGLMQIIEPTFRAWALPGQNNIWNPADNIVAAVRYAIATYGSVSKVPGVVSVKSGGSYQGY